jgi:hypothetical protein
VKLKLRGKEGYDGIWAEAEKIIVALYRDHISNPPGSVCVIGDIIYMPKEHQR